MFNKYITKPEDLITSHEQTRAGFLRIALEKNIVGDPYVKNAITFKALVSDTFSPDDFLEIPSVRPFLLTAAGISDKAQKFLSEEDRTIAIKELIEKFLKPAGQNYVDETVFRYLLIKGDALGGTMRNRIGALGQEKLVRSILSCLNVQGIDYYWLHSKNTKWSPKQDNDYGIEQFLKGIFWNNFVSDKILLFNTTIPIVKKNVDICLFRGNISDYENGSIFTDLKKSIMFGELKGGIDPAGADEHWKTANTALNRIKNSFEDKGIIIKTSFVGAAIEKAMAREIFNQLESNKLSNAANLTEDNQLTEYSNWIVNL